MRDRLGSFADPAMEARFQDRSRGELAVPVRGFAAVSALIILAYAALDSLIFSGETARDSLGLAALWLALVGGWAAASAAAVWRRAPLLDVVILLALALVQTEINQDIFTAVDPASEVLVADPAFPRMLVSAFAAVVLASRRDLFLAWLLLHAGFFGIHLVDRMAGAVAPRFEVLGYAATAIGSIALNWLLAWSARRRFAAAEALDAERARNEELLHNVLPQAVATRLKSGETVVDSFADASVVFIDIVGFSVLSRKVSPGHLLELLNGFFQHADACAAACGVEKVKTIGDAYLAIAGGTIPSRNSADAAIAFGRAVIAGLAEVGAAAGVELKVRVGIHSGPVVGGVINGSRMAYDYWGDTLNVAARLEGTAPHNGLAISETTWLRARDRSGFGEAEVLPLKGVGETPVYRSLA